MGEIEKKHRIKANLHPNLLTDNPNDYTARVISERTLNIRDVCVSSVKRGGVSGSIDAMELNVNLFLKEMDYLMRNGFSINANYFNAGLVIKGIFDGPFDTFDSKRHGLYFQFLQGEVMRKTLNDIEVQIMGVGNNNPSISTVIDVKTGSINDRITPGRNLKIEGNKLKLCGNHTNVGIYFIEEASGIRVKVPDNEVVLNNPKKLIILTPELNAGTYSLEVITQFNSSSILKEPRTAQFERLLTVD